MTDVRERLPLSLAHETGSPIATAVAAARRVGPSGANALVYGEPGTGKEALARIIHDAADPAAPFAIVRCHGREDRAVALELFGAADGAPGAGRGVLAARRGTLLLEEVTALGPELQGRLADALADESSLDHAVPARARVVGTSTQEVLPLVASGAFRRDLYDVLSSKLRLPPVRERRDDVLAVVDRAWTSLGERRVLADGARALVREYTWPGNAREIVEFVRLLAAGSRGPVITVRDVERELFAMTTGLTCWGPPDAGAAEGPRSAETPATATRRLLLDAGLAFAGDEGVDLVCVLRSVEAGLIEWALQRAAGNKAGAAHLLGIHRTTLVEKLRRRRGSPAEGGVELEPERQTDAATRGAEVPCQTP
jgi:DNA-binding NtrC family response regulator